MSRRDRAFPFRFFALLVLPLIVVAVGAAEAVTRTCGVDPVANTADVLCAPPSGPCTATEVRVGANLRLDSDLCRFALGGRDLVIARRIDAPQPGAVIRFDDAAAVVIERRGKIRQRAGFGLLTFSATGPFAHHGVIDVSGELGGEVSIAAREVRFARGSSVRANGRAPLFDDERIGDGGFLDIETSEGDVIFDGTIVMRTGSLGAGGVVDVFSAADVQVLRPIDLRGGAFGGGELAVIAAGDIVVAANVDVASRGGDGDGGIIALLAGISELGGDGVGSVEIRSAILDLRGDVDEMSSGDGGDLDVIAPGPIVIAPDVVIRGDAPGSSLGRGAFVYVDAIDGLADSDGVIGATDGAVSIGGVISLRGGSRAGLGGELFIQAGRSLELTADVDVSGSDGGSFIVHAGANAEIGGRVADESLDPAGFSGAFEVRAGLSTGDTPAGNVQVTADVRARGAGSGVGNVAMLVSGCTVSVAPGVVIDRRGSSAAGVGGVALTVQSMTSAVLGAGSRYLLGPSGSVTFQAPPGAAPVFEPGVTFDVVPVVDSTSPMLPNCS